MNVQEKYQRLEDTVRSYNPGANFDLIRSAFHYAEEHHRGQNRKDGSPFVTHPLAVAQIVAEELHLDSESIAAALLHDTIEDTDATHEDIARTFSPTIADIVEGVSKLTRVQAASKAEEQMENLRKMLLAMSKDIRVILIKMADRLHNMRTMEYQTPEKQKQKSLETMEIYAPIAHRLGMQKMKWELEDLSLKYLDPIGYQEIIDALEEKASEYDGFMASIHDQITKRLQEAGIQGTVYGRMKHPYSIYRKMYTQNKSLDDVFDLFAFRVIVNTVSECYHVLGKSMQEIVATGMIDRSGSLGVLKTRKPVTLEQTFRTGKQALITSTPHFDSSGEITMIITVVRDMTEIYGLQRKYQESEERRRSEMEFLQRNQRFVSRMVAADPRTLEVLARAQKVAALDTTILLLGETGVGKEQFARYIYENSARARQSFIGINCGAIPASLIESELFGYEKGAFTGASKEGKMGVFESADKGTVFLDEVGDLPLEMQVHLLRVLQEMQVRRVGGVRSISVDVRIIAATNRNLLDMVHEKTFREDLYYRLNVVPIEIPPLRERKRDIRPLVESFLKDMNKKYRYQKRFAGAAMEILYSYVWPGNVRELKNVVEQAVILSAGDEIQPSELPIACRFEGESHGGDETGRVNLKLEVARFEYEYICRAYEKYGTVRAAAASLGMDSATFVRKRRKFEELLQK